MVHGTRWNSGSETDKIVHGTGGDKALLMSGKFMADTMILVGVLQCRYFDIRRPGRARKMFGWLCLPYTAYIYEDFHGLPRVWSHPSTMPPKQSEKHSIS